MLDVVHTDAPIFDYGNDGYTRQLQKARQRWAKQAEREQRNMTKTQKIESERRSKTIRMRVIYARLPDISRLARISDRVEALRPFADGRQGVVRPADAIAAMAHLYRVAGAVEDEGGQLPHRRRVR